MDRKLVHMESTFQNKMKRHVGDEIERITLHFEQHHGKLMTLLEEGFNKIKSSMASRDELRSLVSEKIQEFKTSHLAQVLSEDKESVKSQLRTQREELIQIINDVAASRASTWTKQLNAQELKDLQEAIEQDLMLKVRPFVKQSLDMYYFNDYLNKTDYALRSMGAVVIASSPNYEWTKPSWLKFPTDWHRWIFQYDSIVKPPETILNSDNTIGNCWAFPGSRGYAVIKLPYPIIPKSFSVDHVSRSIAPDMSSAPRIFSVYGFAEGDVEGELLGEYEYSDQGPVIQNFPVEKYSVKGEDLEASQETRIALANNHPKHDGYKIFNIKFESNYGNQEYTCVYRFRVHGLRINSSFVANAENMESS
ncbi:hypothetical protein AKO1_003068, partial [Acrasis kona]